jgi:transcriptional regulator GlxA family with amidase domain
LVLLEPDVLFVDAGSVLTAAGSAAALDLGQHLIRRDHDADVANTVSRRLVFAAHRDGGQRQFVDVVARASCLGTAANLRALLRRHTGLTPSAYRRRFGT